MNDQQKIALAECVLAFLKENTASVEIPKAVDTLAQSFGLNGFKKADIGTPVFEYRDKYLVYLETLDGKRTVEVPFNIHALQINKL